MAYAVDDNLLVSRCIAMRSRDELSGKCPRRHFSQTHQRGPDTELAAGDTGTIECCQPCQWTEGQGASEAFTVSGDWHSWRMCLRNVNLFTKTAITQ